MSGKPAEHTGVAPSPAQWALARMLDAAFDDRETAARCMDLALTRAGLRTVPEGIDETLQFGREHLLPILAEELGPRLVQALFEDLTAELMRRSAVHAAADRASTSSAPRLTVPPIISERPRSNPTIHSPAPADDAAPARPIIAVVEPDRWVRASVARVLVQNGCDVLPLDEPTALVDAPYEIDVVVIDLGRAELEAVRALAARRRGLRVVAWTRLETSDATRRLDEIGVARTAAVPRTAPTAHLADTVRTLLSAAS